MGNYGDITVDATSDTSVSSIFNMMQQAQRTNMLRSELALKEAQQNYIIGLQKKGERATNRLSAIGDGFNWNLDSSDPTTMFSTALPSMDDAWDTYKTGQESDEMGADRQTFINEYRSSAISNLNLQIGTYNVERKKIKALHPGWTESNIDDYMAKEFNADILYSNYQKLGGMGASSLDSKGQAIALNTLEYEPPVRKQGLLEKAGGLVVDPYTGKIRGFPAAAVTALVPGGILHVLQSQKLLDKAKTMIVNDAAKATEGGLSKAKWKEKYPKHTKSQAIKDAKNLAKSSRNKTLPEKFLKKTGLKGVLPYLAPSIGEALDPYSPGGNVGQSLGIAYQAKKVLPGTGRTLGGLVKKLATKLPARLAKKLPAALLISQADSPVPGPADVIAALAAIGITGWQIATVVGEWYSGE